VYNFRCVQEFPSFYKDIAYKDNRYIKIPIQKFNEFVQLSATNVYDKDVIGTKVSKLMASIEWLSIVPDTNRDGGVSLSSEIADGLLYHMIHREGVSGNGAPSIVDKQRESTEYYKHLLHTGDSQAIVENITYACGSLAVLVNTSAGWWDTINDIVCWHKSLYTTRNYQSNMAKFLSCEMDVYVGDNPITKVYGLSKWLLFSRLVVPYAGNVIMRFGSNKGLIVATLTSKIGLLYFLMRMLYNSVDFYLNRAHYSSMSKGLKRRVIALYKYDVLHPYHHVVPDPNGTPYGAA
jgi:hypothetical protein